MKTLTIVAYTGQEYAELDLINSLKKQEIFSEEKTKESLKKFHRYNVLLWIRLEKREQPNVSVKIRMNN